MKILTFTPVWQRPDIFAICLKGIKRLMAYDPQRFQIQPFFMVSESWAATLLQKNKFDFIYVANNPLGAKKNEGLKYAIQNYKFDYLMELGSDDLLTSAYLELIEPYMKAQAPQFHPSSIYLIDVKNSATAYWETSKILGAGRCISCEALKKVRVPLWNPEGQRGMDTYSWNMLLRHGIGNTIIKANEIYALDIKSEVNINQLGAFMKSPKTLDEILTPFAEAADIYKAISIRQKQPAETY